MNKSEKSQHQLLLLAKERFSKPESQIVHFVQDDYAANTLLNDLANHPHAFVLACLMDRQIKAEKAWMIPVQISRLLGTFDIKELEKIKPHQFKKIFNDNKLHRFNDTMADVFYCGVKDIVNIYNGNAAAIWANNPGSASVVYRFMEFKGSGIKIATMAANILARQFRIPFSDYYSIDISPDVHVIRVMKRMGFVSANATTEKIIYKAREINPEFPGIIDFSCWEIGRNWCKPQNPLCSECIVKDECKGGKNFKKMNEKQFPEA